MKRRHITVADFYKTCDVLGDNRLTRRDLQLGLENVGIVLDYREVIQSFCGALAVGQQLSAADPLLTADLTARQPLLFGHRSAKFLAKLTQITMGESLIASCSRWIHPLCGSEKNSHLFTVRRRLALVCRRKRTATANTFRRSAMQEQACTMENREEGRGPSCWQSESHSSHRTPTTPRQFTSSLRHPP